jgi:hypothetical protein
MSTSVRCGHHLDRRLVGVRTGRNYLSRSVHDRVRHSN